MEKIDNVLLIGSSGQIGSNIKNNLKKISKKTYCPLRKDFNLENLKSIDKYLNKIKRINFEESIKQSINLLNSMMGIYLNLTVFLH